MATRETFSIRLSSDEKALLTERAQSFGMSSGSYARYCLFNAPPPPSPLNNQSLPAYDSLVSQVQTLAYANAVSEAVITNLASSDTNVAKALDQARSALGPRED